MSRGKHDIEVIGHYAPDLARQVKALRLVLRRQPPANESTVEKAACETTGSNAPAGKPTEASPDIGTVTSSVTNTQGTHNVTTNSP